MNSKGTTKALQPLIILENFFCINRFYLFRSKTAKIISLAIFLTTLASTIAALVYDFIIADDKELDYSKLFLYFISGFELLYLINDGRTKKTFNVINRLDEKCGVDEEYYKEIKSRVKMTTFYLILSAMVDIGALIWKKADISLILLFGIATSAHDAEMDLIRLLIVGFNKRLEMLKDATPSAGSRVYRHVLLTVTYLAEEFNSKILIMLAATLIKTIVYTVFAVLIDIESFLNVGLLIWWQFRSLYSLWRLCLAASKTKTICDTLAYNLAKKLSLDPATCKVKHRKQYEITRRWFKSLIKEKPQYMSGAIQSIDLNMPLNIFDLSVNYLLIIVQVYAAYK